MLMNAILMFLFLRNSFAFENIIQKFSTDYFKSRNVKFVCLLECQEHNFQWVHNFAILASKSHNIATSVIFLDKNGILMEDLRKCLHHKLLAVGVLIKSQCIDNPGFNQLVSDEVNFNDKHKWLILTEKFLSSDNKTSIVDANYNTTLKIFGEANLSVDADIVIATQEGSNEYIIKEVYNFGKIQRGTMIVSELGKWNIDTGFAEDLNRYKYYRRWDFKNLKLRMIVAMALSPANSDIEDILTRRTPTGVAVITKTSSTLIHELAKVHNIKFNYTICEQWIRDFNRNSTRVVASALYFKEQDISPMIRINSIRSFIGVIHPPLTSIETRYFYRIPNHGIGKFENQFLRPLTTEVWSCVVAIMIVCGVVILMAAKFEKRPTSVQYALFSTVASFCQQFFVDEHTSIIPRVSTARNIAVLVTGLSSVLIYNYYTSSVVSWLLNGPPPSINSLEELIESPLQLILEDIGYSRSWLQAKNYYFNKRYGPGEDGLRAKKLHGKDINSILKAAEIGIDMVKAGGYVFHTEVGDANALISRKFKQKELCELGSLPSMERTPVYACLQKDSPYTEFWIWSMSRMRERGIVSCIQRRTSSPPISCDGSVPRALALGGAIPAFIVLAVGFVFSSIIVIIERLTVRKAHPFPFLN